MKDLSNSAITWPIPDRPMGGTGSPVASSTHGEAWESFTAASGNDTAEEVPNEGPE